MHPCRLCSSKGHPACLPSPPRYSRQLPELEQVLLHVLAAPGRAWAWPLHGGAAPACRFQHRDAGQLHSFLPGQRLGEGVLPGRQSRRRQETDGSGRRTRGGLRGRGGGASPAAPRSPRFADWGCLRGHPSLPDDTSLSECL